MSIHEHLPKPIRHELKQLGWSKAADLAKVARRDREQFKSADWLHKAQSMPHQRFKEEVEKYLTGESEASELIYFKVYKSQLPVIEQAIDTAALMLGSDKSRGYCLEMICADFLAGAQLGDGDAKVLLSSTWRLFQFLPGEQKREFLRRAGGGRVSQPLPKCRRLRLDADAYRTLPHNRRAGRLEMPSLRLDVRAGSSSHPTKKPDG